MNTVCKFRIIDTDTTDLEELTTQLKQDGYSVTINNDIISIGYDPATMAAKRSRGAGRKSNMTDKSCAEVYQYRRNTTAQVTANWLGIGLRTYQRMEKSVRDAGFWNEDQAAQDAVFMRYDTDNINHDIVRHK